MGYLNDKSVYLCGAMQMTSDDGIGWRDYITPTLKKYGLNISDPTRKQCHSAQEIGDNKELFKSLRLKQDFKQLKKVFMPVARWDLRSVDKADFLIVAYDPCIPTVGTIDEIVIANMQRKPILMKYDPKKMEQFSSWMVVRIEPEHMFPTWKKMFKYLDSIDKGNIDPDYWTL